jgi:RHS repeat-associated protein
VGWNIFETRNGSNQATRQWVWGTRYVDEILFMDVNGSPTSDNDCDPDTTVGGMESSTDRRYFYHQDRNWNVVALTEYADGVGTNGRIAERYAYTPYGEFIVLKGDAGIGELGRVLPVSTVGNIFFHQGLVFDPENYTYQNRRRGMAPFIQQFTRRDPMERRDGMNLYAYVQRIPLARNDPGGDIVCGPGACEDWANLLHPHRKCCRETGSCIFNYCEPSQHWCEWDSDGCHRPNTQPAQWCDCGESGAIHHHAGEEVDRHDDPYGCAFGTGIFGECLWDLCCVFVHFWHDVLHLP